MVVLVLVPQRLVLTLHKQVYYVEFFHCLIRPPSSFFSAAPSPGLFSSLVVITL